MEEVLYEGKAKILYRTDNPSVLLVHFKDEATAFNAQKKGIIPHKGEYNCTIASHILQYLQQQGIPNHFIRQVAPAQMLVQAVKILPLEVVVRNIAAGSLCKRLGIEQGRLLAKPVVEFYYKNDDLGDPLLNEDHIALLQLATPDQVELLRNQALAINDRLQPFFRQRRLKLVDFKLEFGINGQGALILADEISPDTCRLWDWETDRVLDKDRFRQDLGSESAAYAEVLRRVMEST
ncbi:MAG: phosphoribosylaminoimidazolesuccinocarboxamide synthase [Pseudanabaenaceae cyanobacterium SKYGB_i_bin29]|nr:phosphoribosylaminoimidazolesuccinocarboxamide synthase [Pseudanabaenaceae cyanobacterium SKYG29]MDW8420592.1 phosphoribosylaminoimidazolesuccinocarboxamide synthase [Pseudanabaenaceae cyanobacterium SKYGB_i_bin29]